MQDHSKLKVNKSTDRLRLTLFYLSALAIMLFLLCLIEVGLSLFLSPLQADIDDPYVSFKGLRPLFVLDATGTHYETSPNRLDFFRQQSFTVDKKPDKFRIFCLGGSTVQGRPYSVETSFSTWLKLNLHAAQPQTDYEVINCGGISYASYRLIPIMRELLKHKPDLFILYTGHNEFLENISYKHVKKLPQTLIQLHQIFLKLRSYSLIHKITYNLRSKNITRSNALTTPLPTEVHAQLDLQNGLKSYHRDDKQRAQTIMEFRRNLGKMLMIAQNAGVPIILMNPVSNLKDNTPFKSEFSKNISGRHREQIKDIWRQSSEIPWSNAYGKIKLLEKAIKLDKRNARSLYMMAKCYQRLGRVSDAKKWFILAKDEDICPLRIIEPMHQVILETAEQFKIPLVDIKTLIENRTEDKIPGSQWLLDHVHPNISGHQLIADSLLETMQDMGLVNTLENWRQTLDELRRSHLDSLNQAYYEQGNMRLERLQKWSRGRIPDSTVQPELISP
jgi:tetratricopeptide (TPR) repeat protein